MKKSLALATALLLTVSFLIGCSSMRGEAGWQTLIDGSSGLANWINVGDANWRAEGGVIMADFRPGSGSAHFLLSRNSYRDFQIHTEFWVSDDANSGVYLRCSEERPITDRTCYEANIFDRRADPSYGTGAITNFAKVNPMPKAGGKWNSYDIEAKGNRISVVLNGVKTAEIEDGRHASGPVGLQFAGGVVKFRKFQIRPL